MYLKNNSLIIDLDTPNDEIYKIIKFPDKSLKFELVTDIQPKTEVFIYITLKSSDDILLLGLIKNVLDNFKAEVSLRINYMMYQQDDRQFNIKESFGLKVISNFINTLNFSKVFIYHPHSDKVEFINNVSIKDNTEFIKWFLNHSNPKINHRNNVWVIPDAGAFKTQLKQIQKLNQEYFIVCNKTRDFNTGEITTVITHEDLQGKDCFIVDDICLGGRTFIQIAEQLKQRNCGDIYLVVSHGVFNYGIEHLKPYFKTIYTTDSICRLPESDFLKIYNLKK